MILKYSKDEAKFEEDVRPNQMLRVDRIVDKERM